MAWQFNNKGFGAAIGEGIKDAEEYTFKEKDRLRQQALDDLAGADKYKKRKVDSNGDTIGYETDVDATKKALNFLRKRLPGYPKTSGSMPTTIKPYQQTMQEQGFNPTTGAASAPQGPVPLLENPNKAKMEQAAADRELDMSKGVLANEEAEKARQHDLAKTVASSRVKSAASGLADRAKPNLSYAEKVGDPIATGRLDAQGNPIKVQPLNEGVAFDDAVVTGSVAPKQEEPGVDPSMINSVPAPIDIPAEEEDPLDVDDYTLRRLVDQVTTPVTSKDGILSSGAYSDELDPELQKRLGVQGQRIFLPFSFIARGIQSQLSSQDKSIGAETYEAVADLESGVPYSVVASNLSKAYGGSVPPQVANELRSARNAIAVGEQRNVINEDRQEAKVSKAQEKQDRALERFEKAYADTGILAAAGPLERLEEIAGVVSGRVNKKTLPGTGTNLARALPFIGDDLAQAVAKGYGGEETSQLIQALANVNIKNASGTAVSKHEMGRKSVEFGMSAFGNEKDVARGIKLMVEGIIEAANSVKSAFPDEVRNQYLANGGKLPEILFGQQEEKEKNKAAPVAPKAPSVTNQEDIPEASRRRIESAKKLSIKKEQLDAIDKIPRPGDVVDGYRYRGGNPAEQSNWEKAK